MACLKPSFSDHAWISLPSLHSGFHIIAPFCSSPPTVIQVSQDSLTARQPGCQCSGLRSSFTQPCHLPSKLTITPPLPRYPCCFRQHKAATTSAKCAARSRPFWSRSSFIPVAKISRPAAASSKSRLLLSSVAVWTASAPAITLDLFSSRPAAWSVRTSTASCKLMIRSPICLVLVLEYSGSPLQQPLYRCAPLFLQYQGMSASEA